MAEDPANQNPDKVINNISHATQEENSVMKENIDEYIEENSDLGQDKQSKNENYESLGSRDSFVK